MRYIILLGFLLHLSLFASMEYWQIKHIETEVFHPKQIIPFASFIRFSHVDNSYMNDQMNKIRNVESFILDNTDSIPIVLYPGDNWSGDKKIDNSIAIKNYEMDLQKKLEG